MFTCREELPGITEDPNVAFPFKVLRLLGPSNVRKHEPGLQQASLFVCILRSQLLLAWSRGG